MTETVEAITAPNLAGLTGRDGRAVLRHAFFTRRGGVSDGIYGGLNCGPGSADRPGNVAENRGRAMAALGLTAEDLANVYQIHSAEVWAADRPRARDDLVKADGLVSTRAGIAVGVLTADCAPVLFADADNGVVAAAHAGWRGAVAGVLDNTVAEMERQGAERTAIHAALGPCIRQDSYEVGDDLRDAFLAAGAMHDAYFAPGERPGHYQFDLAGFIMDRLNRLGLASAADTGLDTYPDGDRFFSYRRTTHRGEDDYGRQLSAIALVPVDGAG